MSVRSWNEPTNRIDHQHRTRLIESSHRNHDPSSDLGLAVTGNAPEPVTRTHKKSPCLRETRGFLRSCWCPGAESNHRHEDFQISCRRKSTILSSSRLSDVLFRRLILPTKDQLRSSYTGFSIFQFRESGKIRVGAPRRAYSDRLPGGCLPKIE